MDECNHHTLTHPSNLWMGKWMLRPCLDGWMQPPPSPIHPIDGWVNGWMPLAHGWMNGGHHSPTHPMEWGMQIYLSIRLVASISHLSTHQFIHAMVSSINPCNHPFSIGLRLYPLDWWVSGGIHPAIFLPIHPMVSSINPCTHPDSILLRLV